MLDRLGIGAQDAYAFGDGTNDLEMIRHAAAAWPWATLRTW